MKDDVITLPATLPGHWNTEKGQAIAERTLTETRDSLCMSHLTDLELAKPSIWRIAPTSP
jgi:hypothetical protein